MKWKIESVISYLARAAIISPDSIFVSYPKSECSIISSDFFLFRASMAAIISPDFTFSFSGLLEQLLSPVSLYFLFRLFIAAMVSLTVPFLFRPSRAAIISPDFLRFLFRHSIVAIISPDVLSFLFRLSRAAIISPEFSF